MVKVLLLKSCMVLPEVCTYLKELSNSSKVLGLGVIFNCQEWLIADYPQ